MKKWICFILLMSLGALSRAETIAVILKSEGQVQISRNNKSVASEIKRGFRLEDGDRIETKEDGQLALRFLDDASLVRVRPNSICIIHGSLEKNRIIKNIYVETGAILSSITQQKGQFRVSTPTSVASVKGTRFITDHRQTEGTYYFGEDGFVLINNEADSTSLGPGETVLVRSRTSGIEKWKTRKDEKPSFDQKPLEEIFEIDFKNDKGEQKTLRFTIRKKD